MFSINKKTTNAYKWLLLLLTLFCQDAKALELKQDTNQLPNYVKTCHRNDPKLNECARAAFDKLKHRLTVGIPDLFIPPIEPLIIPEIKMNQNSGAVYMHSTYSNVKFTGLSNFTINELNIEPAKLRFSVCTSFPYLEMQARYSMKGKIMMMPLMGEGNANVNFTNVMLHTKIEVSVYKKNNANYIKIKDIAVKYTLSNVKIHLDNLFNGDKALGDRMNQFLNENWQSLAEEIRPLMEKALIDVLRSSTDKLFETYSYDDILPM